MKVTQWFDIGNDPARKGAYEIRLRVGGELTNCGKSYFDGKRWSESDQGSIPWSAFGDQWRGLAEKP